MPDPSRTVTPLETAQTWLEHMADAWLVNPQVAPSFPPGLHIRETGWRVILEPQRLTPETMYQAVKYPDEVMFYAVLGGGREVQVQRRWPPGVSAARPSWQPREPMCPDEEVSARV